MKFFNPEYFSDEIIKLKEIEKITENDPEYMSIKNMAHNMAANLSCDSAKRRFIKNFYDYLETITSEKNPNIYGAISCENNSMYVCSNFNTDKHKANFIINVLENNMPVILWFVKEDILSVYLCNYKKALIILFYDDMKSAEEKLRVLEGYFYHT